MFFGEPTRSGKHGVGSLDMKYILLSKVGTSRIDANKVLKSGRVLDEYLNALFGVVLSTTAEFLRSAENEAAPENHDRRHEFWYNLI